MWSSNFLYLRGGALSSFFDGAMQRTSAPNIAGAHLPQRARGYWKARFSATREGVERFLERERGQLPLWLVVGFGAGIASWFAPGPASRLDCRHLPGRGPGPRRVRPGGRAPGTRDGLARSFAGSWMQPRLAPIRMGGSPASGTTLGGFVRGRCRKGRDISQQGRPAADPCVC